MYQRLRGVRPTEQRFLPHDSLPSFSRAISTLSSPFRSSSIHFFVEKAFSTLPVCPEASVKFLQAVISQDNHEQCALLHSYLWNMWHRFLARSEKRGLPALLNSKPAKVVSLWCEGFQSSSELRANPWGYELDTAYYSFLLCNLSLNVYCIGMLITQPPEVTRVIKFI